MTKIHGGLNMTSVLISMFVIVFDCAMEAGFAGAKEIIAQLKN